MNLTQQKCVACEVGGLPLDPKKAALYMKDLSEWKISDDSKKILRVFTFKDFKGSIAFINKVAELAENEGHHPDIAIHYDTVTIELWTHAVGGLSLNDFIVAAKIDLTL